MKYPQLTALASFVCALTVTSPNAMAVGNSFDPTTQAVTVPFRSSQTTTYWKLAGRINVGGTPAAYYVSGVQILPQWMLTSRHSSPEPGSTFQNTYGSAQIDAPCYYQSYEDPNGGDISLCHLATPIATGGDGFPSITISGGSSGMPLNLPRMPGYTFMAAYGVPFNGSLRAAWSNGAGMDPSYNPVMRPDITTYPYVGDGDSGAGVYWFAPERNVGTLIGLRVDYGSLPVGNQVFWPSIAAWINSLIPAQENLIVWTTPRDYAPRASAVTLPPPLEGLQVSLASATAADFKWKRPSTAVTREINSYRLSFRPVSSFGSGAQSINVQENSTGVFSYRVNNLVPNTQYNACVVPMGSGGSALYGSIVGTPAGVVNTTDSCASFTTGAKSTTPPPTGQSGSPTSGTDR